MTKILTIYVPFLLIVSCGGDEHWSTISTKGLDGQFSEMLFINDSTGWIAGSKLKLSLKNQDAIICKTVDGGRTWTRSLVGKGSVEHLSYVNDTLYGVKHVFSQNSFEDLKSVLVKSIDAGRNWSEVAAFAGYTKHLSFVNGKLGYLITDNNETRENDWKLLETMDGGITWTLRRTIKSLQSAIIVKKSFFVNQIHGTSLLVFDLENDTLLSEEFPDNFRSDFLVKDNSDNIWAIGRDTSEFVMLKRESEGKFYRIKLAEIAKLKPHDFWTRISIIDSTIAIIIGDNATLLGVTHRFFISHNLGMNWAEEEIPFSLIVDPICFYRRKIWSYDGTGLLKVREPEIAW